MSRRSVRRLALAIGLCFVGLVAFGVYSLSDNRPAPVDLPPFTICDVEGIRTPVMDSAVLARFAEQHQLPEMPDLTQLSEHTARDIHDALEGVEQRPCEADALGQLGRVFQSHKYSAKALECYSRARSKDPSAFQWSYYIGRIHAEAYAFEPAIAAYERAAELNSKYASTFLALGKLYHQSGDEGKARKALQRFVALRPQSSHGYLGLAQIAFDASEYESAIKLLSDAISRNSKDFRVHNLLAQTYQQLGQAKKARYHLAIVKNLDRQDQLTKHVFFDDPLYHKMLSANSTDAALRQRMRAAMGTRQSDVAIQLAEELSRRHPGDAVRVHSLAVALKQAKRFPEALDRVDAAIRLDTNLLEAHTTKAQLLMILRRNDEALEVLDWIVAQDPNSFDGHYNRGAARVLTGQYEAAVESFRQAIRLKNGSARAHVALAEALGQMDQRAEARDEYRRALELDPANTRALQRLRETKP